MKLIFCGVTGLVLHPYHSPGVPPATPPVPSAAGAAVGCGVLPLAGGHQSHVDHATLLQHGVGGGHTAPGLVSGHADIGECSHGVRGGHTAHGHVSGHADIGECGHEAPGHADIGGCGHGVYTPQFITYKRVAGVQLPHPMAAVRGAGGDRVVAAGAVQQQRRGHVTSARLARLLHSPRILHYTAPCRRHGALLPHGVRYLCVCLCRCVLL